MKTFTLLILLVASSATAQDIIQPPRNLYWVGMDLGFDRGGSVGFDLGRVWHDRCAFLKGGIILNGNAPKYEDTEIPHSSYRLEYFKANEYCLAFGYGPVYGDLALATFAGIAWQSELALARSDVTGWYWKQGEESTVWFYVGGEARYIIADSFNLRVGYSNRRGAEVGFGVGEPVLP